MTKSDLEFRRYLDIESLEIGTPEFDKSSIIVPVYNLIIFDKHPRFSGRGKVDKCKFIFEDVRKSERQIAEYESPEGQRFTRVYTVSDGPFPSASQLEAYLFHFYGVLKDPPAWIYWNIEASAYHIEFEDKI